MWSHRKRLIEYPEPNLISFPETKTTKTKKKNLKPFTTKKCGVKSCIGHIEEYMCEACTFNLKVEDPVTASYVFEGVKNGSLNDYPV